MELLLWIIVGLIALLVAMLGGVLLVLRDLVAMVRFLLVGSDRE